MSRFLIKSLLLLVLCAPSAFGALEMSIQCIPQGSGSQCTTTTTNTGGTLTGDLYTGVLVDLPPSQVTLSDFSNSFGLQDCFDSTLFGGDAELAFIFCFGFGSSLGPGGSFTSSVRVSSATAAPTSIQVVAFTFFFDSNTGDELASAIATTDLTPPSCTPAATIAPLVSSGIPYTLSWTSVSQANAMYEVQESTASDFSANVQTMTTFNTSATFQHTVSASTIYYYRVRAVTCSGSPGPFSTVASTVVQAPPAPAINNAEAAVPFGSTAPVTIPIMIPGAGSGATFSATIDKPYLSVSPSSGSLPLGGTIINVIGDPRDLPPGASTGTLSITTTTPDASRLTTHASTTKSVPISISLVTPVTPGTKTTPAENALIIPVVTHVNGATGPFLSDVRLTNDSTATTGYRVTFTPTGGDVTQSRSTTISVQGGQTIALNDIVKNFFGVGATSNPNDAGAGSLDIRPVGSTNNLTFASSRTYVRTTAGTLGQFVAAVPFNRFATNSVSTIPLPGGGVANAPRLLSLQQIAQSTKFRTNLGLVEGSGNPANGRIRVLDIAGTMLREIPYSLKAGEHRQLNSFLAANGITNLQDGRIEITIDSPTGAVSAYCSVLDNLTTDPLAVVPVDASTISSTRYVLPGIADLNNPSANFHSDIRIYNGGTAPVTVTMTYYPQGNPAGARPAAPVTIAPGEVKVYDNVLPTVFNAVGTGGAIVMTTGSPSSLVVTGRTFSIAGNGGTFGQFIPGVTPAEGMGAGDRPLQILQLEQSQNFRSNVGLSELTGNPVSVEISLFLPDSRVSVRTTADLAANEFRQLNSVIASLVGQQSVYNARMTVKVIGGSGRVTAYGSVIDNATVDPTYVPAQ